MMGQICNKMGAARVLLLLAAFWAVGLGGCLPDPFRGSEVVLELGTQNSGDLINRSTEHYELFVVINDGLISIGRFTINQQLDALDFPSGEKIGVATRLPAEGLPQSGIFFTTEANLAGATEVLISIEENGETDPSPGSVIVGRGQLNDGQRSVLVGFVEGEVPTLAGGNVPLVDSRVAVVLGEEEVDD